MNIVILAAGKGVRMKSALPKVLHPLAGRPLLSHVLATAGTLPFTHLIVVTGAGGDLVRKHHIDVDDVIWVEQVQQLGTGDAVKAALSELTEDLPTLVLYGDVPCISSATLSRMIEASAGGDRLVLLTAKLDNPTGYGRIIRDGDGKILAVVEEKDATVEQKAVTEINTGMVLFPPGRLAGWLSRLTNDNAQKEYYLTDIVEMAASDSVEIVSVSPDHRFEIDGVNNFFQLAALERAYQRHLAEALMIEGVRIVDPDRIDIRGTLRCGRDVSIDVGCVFEGEVTLGDNVSVGAHCVLRDISIDADSRLEPFCLLESSTVGREARIGPYSRLRPGSRLADEVHIGNFVEIKNSTVAKSSKVNHLTYIGDADIGRRVNVGAGTITCNYDGANKYRTRIEDDVFIGSDTQLVAPVTVEQGATIGAGTTLTKDAPPGSLTLSRSPQRTVANWKRPTKS